MKRNAFRNWVEYLAGSMVMGIVLLLPTRMVMAGLSGLARLANAALRERTRATRRNVERTLGHAAESAEARKIVAGSYQVMVRNVFEPTLADRAMRRGARAEDMVTVEGEDILKAAFATGRPVLVCTGHFGAWEMIPVFLARCYTPVWSMARELDNPLLERGLLARRLRFVAGNLPKSGAGIRLKRVMRRGEPLGLLLDQNAGRKGEILPFLGVPSSHHTTAGVLARLFDAIPLPMYMLREPGDLRFRLVVEPPIALDPGLGEREAELDVTRKLSRSLEARVREAPGEYLWLHDRWRHALRVLERDRAAEPATERTGVPAAQGTNGV